MSKWKIVLSVVVVLIAAYIATAPYITVHQMKVAAENHDGEALSEYIDFPSVRESLKDQMNVMMAKSAAKEMKNDPFSALGAAFVGMFVDKMVDAFVTPAGIAQLMAGEKPGTDTSKSPSDAATQKDGATQEPWLNATMGYESLNKFVVAIKDEKNDVCKFILRRDGIGWKLTQIIIPLQ